jgi:hypothetical protein
MSPLRFVISVASMCATALVTACAGTPQPPPAHPEPREPVMQVTVEADPAGDEQPPARTVRTESKAGTLPRGADPGGTPAHAPSQAPDTAGLPAPAAPGSPAEPARAPL